MNARQIMVTRVAVEVEFERYSRRWTGVVRVDGVEVFRGDPCTRWAEAYKHAFDEAVPHLGRVDTP